MKNQKARRRKKTERERKGKRNWERNRLGKKRRKPEKPSKERKNEKALVRGRNTEQASAERESREGKKNAEKKTKAFSRSGSPFLFLRSLILPFQFLVPVSVHCFCLFSRFPPVMMFSLFYVSFVSL